MSVLFCAWLQINSLSLSLLFVQNKKQTLFRTCGPKQIYKNSVNSEDLQRHVLKLKCSQDLMKLSVLAHIREGWKQLVKEIVKAGEASSLVSGEATLL